MAEAPLIAIVDDDKSIRTAIQDLLKAAGFCSTTFEDAESFLGAPARATVSCLITDMRMRGMTGLELHQQLVAAGRKIPTIIITAYPAELAQIRAREAGITCHLTKPFTPDELLDCVRMALYKSHAGYP